MEDFDYKKILEESVDTVRKDQGAQETEEPAEPSADASGAEPIPPPPPRVGKRDEDTLGPPSTAGESLLSGAAAPADASSASARGDLSREGAAAAPIKETQGQAADTESGKQEWTDEKISQAGEEIESLQAQQSSALQSENLETYENLRASVVEILIKLPGPFHDGIGEETKQLLLNIDKRASEKRNELNKIRALRDDEDDQEEFEFKSRLKNVKRSIDGEMIIGYEQELDNPDFKEVDSDNDY